MQVDVTRIAQELIDTLLAADIRSEEMELLRSGAITGINLLYEALREEFNARKEEDHGPAN